MSKIYLDNAATTPLDLAVKEAMIEAMEVFGNPSSIHAIGRESKALMEGCRRSVAEIMHCLPSEIVFTSGGTEADNLAVIGLVEANNIKTIISSPIEHHAVIDSINKAKQLFNCEVKLVNLLPNGNLDLSHFETLLSENPNSLVSLMHVNNELGNILDMERVGNLCSKYQAIFHSDMVQSVGKLAIDLNSLPIHAASFSAHKINGPKGVGMLYLKKGIKLASQSYGGKQEREVRTGTENVIGIAGFTKSLNIFHANFEEINTHISELKSYFLLQIKSNLPGVVCNGNGEDFAYSSNAILSLNFPMVNDNELLLFQLDLQGVMVSGGSACSSGSHTGSHVLNAIGVEGATIRFSFGKDNTKDEIDRVIAVLKEVIDK